jgi:hypothetical protein
MPKTSSVQSRSLLKVTITGRGVIVDDMLRDSTDRAVRFALARFGSMVRAAQLVYVQAADETPACTVRVAVPPSANLVVRHQDVSLELALRGALRAAAAQVAASSQERAKHRIRA